VSPLLSSCLRHQIPAAHVSELRISSALSFHHVTNCFSCNSHVFTTIQIPPGGDHSASSETSAFPLAMGYLFSFHLFARSLTPSEISSGFLSVKCKLFCKIAGVASSRHILAESEGPRHHCTQIRPPCVILAPVAGAIAILAGESHVRS
jgi:hypothetical protein